MSAGDTHGSSTVLERLSQFNLDRSFDCISRKRKRNEAQEVEESWGKPFIINASWASHVESADADCDIFLVPHYAIPRACLPLAFLDAKNYEEDRALPNLFTARIKALESLAKTDSRQPMVLVVECMERQSLHAVEEIHNSCYALCPLAPWVRLSHIADLKRSTPRRARRDESRQIEALDLDDESWWQKAAISRADEPWSPEHRGEVVPEMSRVTKAAEEEAVGADSQLVAGCSGHICNDTSACLDSPKSSDDHQRNVEEALAHVRSQYQDALYASKAPLAYFAKGPLSRARACLQHSDGSAGDCSHLITHLRSLILPLPLLDKKYRDALPAVVRGLPFDVAAEDQDIAALAPKIKSRKSKKTRIGKDGLYPNEEAHVAQWWMNKDISNVACDTDEARELCTRTLLNQQRSRETQLQIILLLETLALEASSKKRAPAETAEIHPAISENDSARAKKPKKPLNLETLLDLLVDRLGIWQSMSIEDSKLNKESIKNPPSAGHSDNTKVAKSNELQQFCVDVVLPFYGARLPDKTTLLCRKLGNPTDPSPKRPTLTKSASVNLSSVKPGAAVTRPRPRDPRKSLARVSTDERPSQGRQTPSLLRSATESMLPQLKREVSEVSLSSVPTSKAATMNRYSQREVDLKAQSHAAEAKLKKKAEIEHQTQDAIAAIRKPNRAMTVKPYVDAAYNRETASQSRKQKNPVRNPLATLVTATPRKDDRRRSTHRLPSQFSIHSPDRHTLEEVLPSSAMKVPCSTTKSSMGPRSAMNTASAKVKKQANSIEQTPTRGPSKFLGRTVESGTLDLSNVASNPRVNRSTSPRLPSYPSHLLTTPAKRSQDLEPSASLNLGVESTPVKNQGKLGQRPNISCPNVQLTPGIVVQEAICDYDADDDVNLL